MIIKYRLIEMYTISESSRMKRSFEHRGGMKLS